MKKINILIVDDHPAILSSLKYIVSKQEYVNQLETVKSGEEALNYMQINDFNLLISDISMEGMSGIELSNKVRKLYPDTKILIFTQYNEMSHLRPLLELKVNGIVDKINENNEIVIAIEKIFSGEEYYSKQINSIIISNLRKENIKISQFDTIKLGKREYEILRYIADELTTREIAKKINRSPETVDKHRSNLLMKFEAKNVAGLVRKAIKYGFID